MKMKPNWKQCPRGDVVGQWSALYVTMNRKGHIAMNRKTFQKMDQPEALHLFFDEVNSRIGLKPTKLAIKDAFPVAKQGRHGGRVVRAYRLMQEFGIDLPETIRFQDIDVDEDGVVILEMRTAKVSTRALGYKKSQAKKSAVAVKPSDHAA